MRRDPPDGFIDPRVPTRAPKPPAGLGWVHEIKSCAAMVVPCASSPVWLTQPPARSALRARRQRECVSEIGLAHIEHEPSHAHAATNMLIDGIENAPGHRFSPLVCSY